MEKVTLHHTRCYLKYYPLNIDYDELLPGNQNFHLSPSLPFPYVLSLFF